MKPRYQASRAALELIKRFEGYRPRAARLADGRWTIGYGHVQTAREGAEVSEADAEALLIYDLRQVTRALNEWIYTPLTQNQFDALAAFAFNVGLENFRRSSVLRRVNEGALIQAACALEMWRKADFEGERIVVDALVRRRAAEKALFLTPLGGWVPAPSPIVRPRVDFEVGTTLPQSATELAVDLNGASTEAHRVPETPAEPPPSAAQVAADAVSARLNAILPDEAETPAPAPAEVEAEVEVEAAAVAADPEPVAEEPPLVETAAEPAADAAPEAEPPAAEPVTAPWPLAPEPVVEPAPEPVAEPEDEPEAEPVVETPAPAEPEPALFLERAPVEPAPPTAEPDVFSLTPPAAAAPDFEPQVRPEPVDDPETAAGPGLFDDARTLAASEQPRRVVWRETPLEADPSFYGEGAGGRRGGLALLASLGLGGLAVFAGGIFWGFNAKNGAAGLFGDPITLGWILGLIGIACVASAVYFLLERLSGRD